MRTFDRLVDDGDELRRLTTLRPREEYHEDYGTVLWFHVPICEPPEVAGIPDEIPEGYPDNWHTHWAPLSNDYKPKVDQ